MKYLLLIATTLLLTACGSKTYIEQRPVVVEKQVTPPTVVIEREKLVRK